MHALPYRTQYRSARILLMIRLRGAVASQAALVEGVQGAMDARVAKLGELSAWITRNQVGSCGVVLGYRMVHRQSKQDRLVVFM